MDGAAAHVVTFGTVAAIEGARARVVLDMAEDGSGFAGPVPPQIGQVVRVDVGEARVFGVIIGLRTPAAEQAIIGPPNQIMDLDLIGEILETAANARFRRGVSEFPRLGDRVSAAGSDDLRRIFTRPEMRQSIASAFGPALRGDISGNSLIWCLMLLAFAYPWFALRRRVPSGRPAIGSSSIRN
jgi:hypothetical protein